MKNIEAVQPVSVDNIKTKIYEFRGQKVMLDFDLATLYHVETRRINEQVKRNNTRFPEDFMFQLDDEEFAILKSQIATSKWGGLRKHPYAFTELGIAMLSSVLSSEIAIQVNINIMRAFVTLRHSIGLVANKDLHYENLSLRIDKLNDYIENVLQTQNDINDDTAAQLELINQTLAELQAENAIRKDFSERKPVGFRIEK
ncbi:MAG: ORF6N domain-containing protein [Bacteroidales bacterium]|nr:ORF6N domain-containing protein [Bacteroidales bacterium]